jgi:hypothetical protein
MTRRLARIGLLAVGLAACEHVAAVGPDAGTDADSDSDTDTDGDGDGDADTDSGTGAEECITGGADAMVMDVPVDISAPVQEVETITFASSDPVYLDVSTPIGEVHHSMIAHFLQNEKPIYVSIVPETREVLDVIQPIEGPVAAVTLAENGAEVELYYSAAIHFLWASNECFDYLYQVLVEALGDGSDQEVSNNLNTNDGIVDVRPAFGL